MSGPECFPVTVEGDWSPNQNRTMKNKLQLYFQSRKKSNGGDCRVELDDGAARAAVHFASAEVRAEVLKKQDHEITVDGTRIRLRVSPVSPTSNNEAPDSSEKSDTGPGNAAAKTTNEVDAAAAAKKQVGNGPAASQKGDSEPGQRDAVVLENLTDVLSKDLLSMIVENILGSDHYSLELVWESNVAVVTFHNPTDVERFLTESQTNKNMKKHKLSARLLEAAQSVRVENLPAEKVKDILDLYFQKFSAPEKIVMIPDEQAAVVLFRDPAVVRSICQKRDHMIASIPAKVYPFYTCLGTALYGDDRPPWQMPKPFTEQVDCAVWKYLLMKKDVKNIGDQMRPYFCRVQLSEHMPEVELSPLRSLLRQKDATGRHVKNWMNTVQEAFRQTMSQYSLFECPVNTSAWKAAEKDVRGVVREDAVLVPDGSRGTLTVAGRADDIRRIRAGVERIVAQTMNRIERETNTVSEDMDLNPVMLFILKQDGLKKATQDISPEMEVSYNDRTEKLKITGLKSEVDQVKSWTLERFMHIMKRPINIDPCLLHFLQSLNPIAVSQDLFTSQGIGAFYTVDRNHVYLSGSSDKSLDDAETKLKTVFLVQTLDVEDQEVLNLQTWQDQTRELLDTYNTAKNKIVAIQIQPRTRDKVTVAGFVTPVKEVSSSLMDFIQNHSRVQETIRLRSSAVVQFINKKKMNEWNSIVKTNGVKARFDSEKQNITVSGARLHVHRARSCFQELIRALYTDTFTVDKPGAKKYFMTQGSLFLSSILTEFSCVVVLRPENQQQEEEEEEDSYGAVNGQCHCKVQTSSGVLVSVSLADLCSFVADAVVNAANEDLQHIGGLALALLKAAGPQLQTSSDAYISQHGRLRPGDATVTAAGNLPSRYVVHTVGPRFSDSDRKTAVSRLKLAVKESLKQAEEIKCSTVALPAISSGVFGFPVDLCAETIAQAVREYCDRPRDARSLTEIHLVDNDVNTVRVLASAVQREFSDLGPIVTEPQAGRKRNEASGGYGRGRGQNRSPRGRGKERGGGYHQKPWGHAGPDGARGSGGVEQTTAQGLKILLCKGNLEHQTTDVIVNTIGEDMNLSQGAVSRALLNAAGPELQSAIRSAARSRTLKDCDVVATPGFRLSCHKVFHVVCPFWNNGNRQSEEGLIGIIRHCLEQAEKLTMASLSFPAIGTGNLGFPRDLVCRILLGEIHKYSSRKNPQHLRRVAIVVHPSDGQTVDCFTREFKGQNTERHVQREHQDFNQPPRKTQQPPASFGQVSSPSLGVYRMQMGPLALEVSSGDITKETSDVIVNSTNPSFKLKSGVSKAILEGAGPAVEDECQHCVNSSQKGSSVIMTSAGNLPSKKIIHIVVQNDPEFIKNMVITVLNTCEDQRFSSVSFPALGTGQGGLHPAAVADAMVGAVVEFVRRKQPRSVRSVKILIFQTAMTREFHKSMERRQGEDVEEKNLLTKFKEFLGFGERPSGSGLVLEKKEFEPAVFQLCGDNEQDVHQAKKRITDLIVAEQATKILSDPFISQLSPDDLEELKTLQRQLTVTIRLDKGLGGQEPSIRLEGLTRDVFTAESSIRDLIRKVERAENRRSQALMVSGLVQWYYQDSDGATVAFDKSTNLSLEEALEQDKPVTVSINNQPFSATARLKRAVSVNGRQQVELVRKDLKEAAAVTLPSHWEDMKGDVVKLFPVTSTSEEYKNVVKEFTRTGLTANIIKIERVQNETLWQSYQLRKKELEKKNKHNNNEKLLFHGTSSNAIDRINRQGFNRSYAGAHGAMYGNGSYFAVDPTYSAQNYSKPDSSGHKPIYLARVLVGDFVQGKSGMITPPSKGSGNAGDLYDSVTDNSVSPTMFVVFNDIQAYPEYLITFT